MTNRARAALLLFLLLLVFPALAALPHQVATIRLAGLSLLWWYGGVVAPLLASLIAVTWLPDPPPSPRAK